jgi:hypothetical protein
MLIQFMVARSASQQKRKAAETLLSIPALADNGGNQLRLHQGRQAHERSCRAMSEWPVPRKGDCCAILHSQRVIVLRDLRANPFRVAAEHSAIG